MSTLAADAPLTLSPAQRQQFEQDGYTLVRNLIPSDLMAAVKAELMTLAYGEHHWPDAHFQILDPAKHRNARGWFVPFGVQLPARVSPTFAQVADHPRLVAAMSQLLGGAVQRFTDQCAIKYGRLSADPQGGCSYYHQDSYYWHLDPRQGCNVWIPTDPVGRDAIALAMMPGSQRDWKLVEHEQYYDQPTFHNAVNGQAYQRHRIPLAGIDFSKEVLLPMQPGDGVFFTNYTWHRSEPNRTGQDLCFYAIAYRLAPKA